MLKVLKKRKQKQTGFTLVELLIASAILAVTVAGILVSYLRSLELNEVSRNSSLAIQAAQGRMEQIKSTAFVNMVGLFDNASFGVTDLDGMGVSYIDNSDPELYEITVSVSWRQNSGRVYGEDADVDGQIDAGEDSNVNGILDSPAQLESMVFNR